MKCCHFSKCICLQLYTHTFIYLHGKCLTTENNFSLHNNQLKEALCSFEKNKYTQHLQNK